MLKKFVLCHKNIFLGLFIVSIIIFLISRLFKIEDFPIYFFCDEAIQTVKAETLVINGLTDGNRHFLPFFFQRFGNLYNLGITPYFHIPALLLFGKKIWATRGTVVLTSLLGSMFIALLMKKFFKLKNYWAVIMFISATPIHFLFSRSAFEGGITFCLYSAFLYFYLSYRRGKTLMLPLAILFAFLSYYSYSGIYIVILAILFILLITDIFYHLKNWKIIFISAILSALLIYPTISFYNKNPDIIREQLKIYDSYLTKNIPRREKVSIFINNYLLTFSPTFLFVYDKTYFLRHYIPKYGYFPFWSLPFIVTGLIYLLINLNKPEYRILLIFIICAPLGGALAEPGSHRIFIITVGISCLFGLGIKIYEELISKIYKINPFAGQLLLAGLFSVLLFQVIKLTSYSLIQGPLWFQDYGLYGMQWGTKQLFAQINKSLAVYDYIQVSPNYANAPEIYVPYFISKNNQYRVKFAAGVDYQAYNALPSEKKISYMQASEFKQVKNDNAYRQITIVETINGPNGLPAFYGVEFKDFIK